MILATQVGSVAKSIPEIIKQASRTVHGNVKTVQDETARGEGAFEVSGARAQDDWARRGPKQTLG
jgi:hypothetical protein